tara:strand:+ start:749 stop:967 length:219 start_codon:yes stop_codon:yes gene_type:complete
MLNTNYFVFIVLLNKVNKSIRGIMNDKFRLIILYRQQILQWHTGILKTWDIESIYANNLFFPVHDSTSGRSL